MSSARESRVSKGSATAEPDPPAEPAGEPEDGPAERPGRDALNGGAPLERAQTGPQAGSQAGATEPAAGFQAEVLDALAALTRRLEREHERAVHREKVIDRLHEENQRLRRGELQSAFEPVRSALYRLHDLACREADRWASPEPPDPAHAAALLAAVADEVADALARTGVERYTVAPGEPYDSARHRPVAVEAVTDPAEDGTVVSVRGHGFERDGRVVRKAEVGVGKSAGEAGDPGPPSREGPSGPHEAGRGETMKPSP